MVGDTSGIIEDTPMTGRYSAALLSDVTSRGIENLSDRCLLALRGFFFLSTKKNLFHHYHSTVAANSGVKHESDRRVPGLMYHHVGPRRPGTFRGMTVSPEHFEKQMRWLASHGYVAVSPSACLEGVELPEKSILLTFDDAYADIAKYALPILLRYGFRAVVFVVSGQVGGTNTWDEARGCGTLQLMNLEQIRYWAGMGIEFGAHGRTHADLTELSAAECSAEVLGSKDDLAAILGERIVSFAYPYGKYNDDVCDLVRSHFEFAFTTEDGINNCASDPHLLNRTNVGPDEFLVQFGLRVRWTGSKRIRVCHVLFGVCAILRRAVRLVRVAFTEESPRAFASRLFRPK